MKRTVLMLLSILMLLSLYLTAFSESGRRVAKDSAMIQTDDPTMPTRLPPENGTKILLHFGDTVIPGMLNDSETAQALIAKLPYTQHMSRYSHDFCGVTEDLPYNEEEEHYGWLNGDIDYATDAPYFTILFEDQDESEIYGSQVNIGVITCPLANIAALNGSYDVLIELDENEESKPMKIKVSDAENAIIFQMNDTPSAKSLYGMLPMDVPVENYGSNEKIFYPAQQIDTAGGIEGSGQAGGLALFSPWGNVVMYYGRFGSYPGLYLLGEAVEGTGQIKNLTGIIHIEAVE